MSILRRSDFRSMFFDAVHRFLPYVAWVEKRENALREEWVKTMEIRITREALGKCQKDERPIV